MASRRLLTSVSQKNLRIKRSSTQRPPTHPPMGQLISDFQGTDLQFFCREDYNVKRQMHKPIVRMKLSIVWFISILHQGLLMTPPKHLMQLNHFHFLTFQLFHFHFSRNISVTRLNQRIFKVLQSFIFAHSSPLNSHPQFQ